MRVLIPTHLDDIHAVAVALALQRKGHEAVLWHGSDYPTRQTSSIEISAEAGVRCTVDGPDLALDGSRFDVVWFRRPMPPRIPPETAHASAGDLQVARREARAYYNAIWQLIAPDAFWVNPLGSRFRSTSKPTQLREALAAGLKVPPTLCSNHPPAIRQFLERCPGEAIFKPFTPTQWQLDDGVAMLFTSGVSLDDLPDDDLLSLCPGIFQHKIEKAYELRLTVLGDHVVVARLLSQDEETARIDWRASFAKLPVEPGEIPPAIHQACLDLMRRLGIVFGCIDLIVTPAGEHVFLEVNEMGQFLWLDEMDPRLMTLDPFCEFLIHARTDFEWLPSPTSVTFQELAAEALAVLDQDKKIHLDRVETVLAPDHEHQHHHHHHHAHGANDSKDANHHQGSSAAREAQAE